LFDRKFFEEIFARLDKNVFAPNIFLSVLAKKRGETLDIPVTHKIRTTGVPSLKLGKLMKVCLRCVKETIALRKELA